MSLARLAALVLALGACTRGPARPAAVDTRNDVCASCRMAVSDAGFAAQLAAPGEGGVRVARRFGLAGLVVFSSSGEEGGAGYALLVLGSFLLTAAFLAIAALIAAAAVGRKRTRALALALVVWFVAVILFDLAALGVASLLPSTAASRLLIVSVIANPAGAVRTGALLGIEGTAAFGSASLAFPALHRGARARGGAARAVRPGVGGAADRGGGAPALASRSVKRR